MKIIRVNYYDKTRMRDAIICDNINEFYGKRIVGLLNSAIASYSTFRFELVDDDYILFTPPELKQV